MTALETPWSCEVLAGGDVLIAVVDRLGAVAGVSIEALAHGLGI